jgi:transcription initiation factor TFIID subunit 2
MLKLADLVFRGAEESPPKVTIHIPRTPVVETTPAVASPLHGSKSGIKGKRLKIPPPVKASGAPPIFATPFGKIKIPSVPVQSGTMSSPPPQHATTLPPAPPPPPKPTALKKGVAFATLKAKQTTAPLKKAKPVQAQSGGMSTNDYRASRSALKKIQSNKHARLFAQPVDPVRDNAPKCVATIITEDKSLTFRLRSYFVVIKQPIDLSSMHAKLENGLYPDRFAFEADFHLMINNAKTYNAPGSWAHTEALALESFFEKRTCYVSLLEYSA